MTSSCLYMPVSVGCSASRIIRTIIIRKGIICHANWWRLSPPPVADHAKIGVCLPKGRLQFSKWTCSILILRVRQPASYQRSSNRAVPGQALAVFLCPEQFSQDTKMCSYECFPEKEKGGARGLAKWSAHRRSLIIRQRQSTPRA